MCEEDSSFRGGRKLAGLYETPKKNFMPRFGFAYRVTEKTVLRGGYGIFYGFLGPTARGCLSARIQQKHQSGSEHQQWLNVPGHPLESLPGRRTGASGIIPGDRDFLGQSITFFNQTPSTSYNQRWELGLQRELGAGFVVRAATLATGAPTSKTSNRDWSISEPKPECHTASVISAPVRSATTRPMLTYRQCSQPVFRHSAGHDDDWSVIQYRPRKASEAFPTI